MIYQLYEAQRALLSPFAEFASASSKLYSHPLSPFAHAVGSQRMAAGFDLLHRLTKEYEKPPFEITSVNIGGVDVAVQEQVAAARPFCRLLRFKRFTDNEDRLLRPQCAPSPPCWWWRRLSGHHSTLLRDTVRTLLAGPQGLHHRLDRRPHGADVRRRRSTWTTMSHYVQDFIRHIGTDNVNVISGVPAHRAGAGRRVADGVATASPRRKAMVMMGGPIDARKSPDRGEQPGDQPPATEWFESNVIYRVPPNYPGRGPARLPWLPAAHRFRRDEPGPPRQTSHWDYFQDLVKWRRGFRVRCPPQAFYDEYNAVLDMPAEYYLDTIKHGVPGTPAAGLRHCGTSPASCVRSVRTSTTTALLTVEGELDDISGIGQTQRRAQACAPSIPKPTSRNTDSVIGAGHYGIFSGRRWRDPWPTRRCATSSPSTKAEANRSSRPPSGGLCHGGPRRAQPAVVGRRQRIQASAAASNASGSRLPRFIACQPPVVTSAPEPKEVKVIVA
jgi:poly(3-hydroxybutyrate) depolymerase